MSECEERRDSDVQASDSDSEEYDAYKCATPEEIPKILEQLRADETDKFDEATEILGNTMQLKEEIATEHLNPKIPYIFDLTKNTPSPERRAAFIGLIWKLLAVGEQSRAAARPFVKDLVALLLAEGPAGNRFYLPQSLETILEDTDQGDELRPQVLELFKTTLFNLPVGTTDATTPHDPPNKLLYIIEALQSILMFGHDTICALAFKAGALDFALRACRVPNAECRKVAVSCIQQVHIHKDKIAEESMGLDSKELQELALNTLIERLDDEDLTIATSTLDFLEAADVPEGFLNSHPTFAEALLVCYIARWETDTHFPAVFDAFVTQNEDDNVVINGFRRVWSEENAGVELDIKLCIVRRLGDVYPSVRQAAVKGGLVAFVLRMLGPNEAPETTVSILNGVQATLEQDQGFGSHLFEGDILPKLVQLLTNTSACADSRALAASTLSSLVESYTADRSEPLRKDVVEALTASGVFPQIALVIQDVSSAKVVGEILNLVCNILKDNGAVEKQEEEEVNNDNVSSEKANEDAETQEEVEKPTMISKLKDRIIDDTLVSSTIAALSLPDAASSASDLLAQIIYNYPRGLTLIAAALHPVVPAASAGFFAALLPEGGRYTPTWEPFHQLEKAVVDAGGFTRLNEIMKGLVEEPGKGGGVVKEVRTAVQGVRALLWGEGVDNDLARENEYLPKLVAALLSDGDVESLIQVKGLMDRLTGVGRENPLEEWKEVVATDEVGKALLKALAAEKPEEQGYDDLDEAMGREEYKKAVEKRQAEEVAASRRYEDTISSAAGLTRYLAPILPSFRTLIATGLLSAWLKDNQTTVECGLESFVSYENTDASNPEYAPLVEAVQTTLASVNPPSPYQILGATRSSLVLGEKNEECDATETLEVVDIFSSIVDRLKDSNNRLEEESTSTHDAHLLSLRTTFFGAPALLKALHTSIIQEGVVGDDWDRYPVINGGETLFKLASGYPACLPSLISLKPSIVPSLVRVYDDEYHEAEASTAPLLGLLVAGSEIVVGQDDSHHVSGLAPLDVDLVKEMVKKHIEQLVEPKDGGKGKGKKGKKKKRYEPRLSLTQALQRFAGFLLGAVATSEITTKLQPGDKNEGKSGIAAALDIAVDSGALGLAFETLEREGSEGVMESENGVLALCSVHSVLKLSKVPHLATNRLTDVFKPRLQGLSGRLASFLEEQQDNEEVEESTKVYASNFVFDISLDALLDDTDSESEGGISSGSLIEAVGSEPWVDALKNIRKVVGWMSRSNPAVLNPRLSKLTNHLRGLDDGKLEDGLKSEIRVFPGGETR
ncbi:hypothetical protein FA13DRAFT_1793051 [Coprinellus micaceus]|uniref:ARM repeat-containing protein n=1 Tax=Coprinellus micaceus TaxID=71717 RepID=A0A4Y7T6J4_COPMI|nr:hypothetical protein FA13DRAFT_1793051 [Coprinellus micaceus]